MASSPQNARKLEDKNVDLFYQKLREAEDRQKESERKASEKKKKRWSWNFGNNNTQNKQQEARDKAVISGPVSVQHEGHLGFTETGKLEMKNLPPAWQSIVESLNKTLKSLGQTELTRDEFAFLVSKFNEVPQTVNEAKEMTKTQNEKKSKKTEKKLSKEELEEALEQAKKKSRSRAQKIRTLQTERAVLVGKNQRLEEAKTSLEHNVAQLEEAKRKLEVELSELQLTYATTKKNLEGQLDLANKKMVAMQESFDKRLEEENVAKAELEKTIADLKLEMEKLVEFWKAEVLAAMKADVKAQKLKDDAELAATKKAMQDKYDELMAKYKQEKQWKEDLDKRRIELESKVAELQLNLDNHNMKEVDLGEMKKNFFKELQNVKGQMLLELKKAKSKYEAERQAREAVEAQLQMATKNRVNLPISPVPSEVPTEPSTEAPAPPQDLLSAPPPEPTNLASLDAPPPPPPNVESSSPQGGLLEAIAKAKLKKAEERKVEETVVLPPTKSLEQNSVADVLAYAILARRTNIEQKATGGVIEEESDESEEEWD